MQYHDLKNMIEDYNWDDGFETPNEMVNDPNCDLALALEIFYLADGYSFITRTSEDSISVYESEWNEFVSNLYINILNNRYKKTDVSFYIPLTKVQKYKLSKKGIPDIFLNDL